MDNNTYKVIKYGSFAAAGIAVFIVGKRIISNIRNARLANESTKALTSSMKQITSNGNATITAAQAQTIANSLYVAMESVGTDESAITALTGQLKTAADWALVISAFGYKDYGTYGAPLYSWLPSTSTNLIGWLRNECGGNLLTQLEKTWATFGIVG